GVRAVVEPAAVVASECREAERRELRAAGKERCSIGAQDAIRLHVEWSVRRGRDLLLSGGERQNAASQNQCRRKNSEAHRFGQSISAHLFFKRYADVRGGEFHICRFTNPASRAMRWCARRWRS